MIKILKRSELLPHDKLTVKEKNKVAIILILAVLCGVCAFTLIYFGISAAILADSNMYDKIKYYLKLSELEYVIVGILILIIGCFIVPRSKQLREITITTIITTILLGISLWSLFYR